jgi:hypothetical protein
MNLSNIYNEKMLMEIIEALPLAICVFDRDRTVLLANGKLIEFTGKTAAQLIGDVGGKALGCIHHDDVPQGCGFGKDCMGCKLRTTVYDALETNQPQTMIETTMVFKDLGEKKLRISANPIGLSTGDAVILAIEDTTQAKIFEQTKIEKERLDAVIKTAGAVCHEINQPLMCIMGYSEFLLDDINPENEQYANLMEIKTQAERLGAITKKLMTITRYKTKNYLKGSILDIENAST